ncbi:hypothetical protein NN561_014433 [Cricetulus griseus]
MVSVPQDCTRTRVRFPRSAIGPGLELPGLHSDSPPESAGSRECFARRQRRSPGLGGQQGVPTKLSLLARLRGATESLCIHLEEAVRPERLLQASLTAHRPGSPWSSRLLLFSERICATRGSTRNKTTFPSAGD